MEFATHAEAAAYRMLTQVLQTHLAIRNISVHTALAACERLLAMTCLQLEIAGDNVQGLVSSTLGGLRQELRARQSHPTVPLYAASTRYEPDAVLRGDPALWLSTVLSRLLDDARQEQGITIAGRWRIAIRLTADLLSVFLLQLKYTREEGAPTGCPMTRSRSASLPCYACLLRERPWVRLPTFWRSVTKPSAHIAPVSWRRWA